MLDDFFGCWRLIPRGDKCSGTLHLQNLKEYKTIFFEKLRLLRVTPPAHARSRHPGGLFQIWLMISGRFWCQEFDFDVPRGWKRDFWWILHQSNIFWPRLGAATGDLDLARLSWPLGRPSASLWLASRKPPWAGPWPAWRPWKWCQDGVRAVQKVKKCADPEKKTKAANTAARFLSKLVKQKNNGFYNIVWKGTKSGKCRYIRFGWGDPEAWGVPPTCRAKPSRPPGQRGGLQRGLVARPGRRIGTRTDREPRRFSTVARLDLGSFLGSIWGPRTIKIEKKRFQIGVMFQVSFLMDLLWIVIGFSMSETMKIILKH